MIGSINRYPKKEPKDRLQHKALQGRNEHSILQLGPTVQKAILNERTSPSSSMSASQKQSPITRQQDQQNRVPSAVIMAKSSTSAVNGINRYKHFHLPVTTSRSHGTSARVTPVVGNHSISPHPINTPDRSISLQETGTPLLEDVNNGRPITSYKSRAIDLNSSVNTHSTSTTGGRNSATSSSGYGSVGVPTVDVHVEVTQLHKDIDLASSWKFDHHHDPSKATRNSACIRTNSLPIIRSRGGGSRNQNSSDTDSQMTTSTTTHTDAHQRARNSSRHTKTSLLRMRRQRKASSLDRAGSKQDYQHRHVTIPRPFSLTTPDRRGTIIAQQELTRKELEDKVHELQKRNQNALRNLRWMRNQKQMNPKEEQTEAERKETAERSTSPIQFFDDSQIIPEAGGPSSNKGDVHNLSSSLNNNWMPEQIKPASRDRALSPIFSVTNDQQTERDEKHDNTNGVLMSVYNSLDAQQDRDDLSVAMSDDDIDLEDTVTHYALSSLARRSPIEIRHTMEMESAAESKIKPESPDEEYMRDRIRSFLGTAIEQGIDSAAGDKARHQLADEQFEDRVPPSRHIVEQVEKYVQQDLFPKVIGEGDSA